MATKQAISILTGMGMLMFIDNWLPPSSPRIVAVALGGLAAIIWLQLDKHIFRKVRGNHD